MRPLALLLLAGCSTAATPPTSTPSPAPPPAAAAPEPASAPADTPSDSSSAEARGSAPAGWSPAPEERAPDLGAARGPDVFYALAGPHGALAEPTDQRARQWLRRNFDGKFDDMMVLAEHTEGPAGLAWLRYGKQEWSEGEFALAIQRPGGWFITPTIAASSKNAPLRIDGPIAAAEIELGPNGLKATEYTVAFKSSYLPGPFAVKLLCVVTPAPACTRPWLARAQRGGKKQPDELLFEAVATYPGDGTIRVEERARAKKWTDAPDWPWRPHAVLGTFTPLAPGK